MPWNLADLRQRNSAAQPLGRQGVAKLTGALRWRLDAGALERMPNDRPNGTLVQEATDESLPAQKHTPTGGARASVA